MDASIKPLNTMSDEELLKIKMVVFDVDGVIIPKGTKLKENEDGTMFHMETHKLSPEFVSNLIKLKKYVKISFSSGRNLLYLRTLTKDIYDKSVILQAENCAMIFINGEIMQPEFPANYFEATNRLRNLVIKNATALKLRGFEPKIFNMAVHMESENELIYDLVKQADPDGVIYCIWTGEAYDVGLKGISKGSGLDLLAKRLGLSRDEIITTGNALNDKEMLEYGVGVTVEPNVVRGKYMTSGNGLGGHELANFLVDKLESLKG
ncbi:MAG: HAD family phosphatase [Candidatus Micrarchaeota archaeon]|nr:HAD family phosphatase [Candidatus Micrarchaeota archaeon]